LFRLAFDTHYIFEFPPPLNIESLNYQRERERERWRRRCLLYKHWISMAALVHIFVKFRITIYFANSAAETWTQDSKSHIKQNKR
jgi:hypothetical protein